MIRKTEPSAHQSSEFFIASVSGDELFELGEHQSELIYCGRGDRLEILFNKVHVSAGEEPQWVFGCWAEISHEGELILLDVHWQGDAKYLPSANPIVLTESNGNAIRFDRRKHSGW
ncbi:hypothetical protein [Reyranella sp.]|uniref:hypothetical protein n=1 Tax=Reyranella sp. TaxID=1929291 RepID=UPI0025EE53C0|nr:hypothetical protein [Reyranella sp.]